MSTALERIAWIGTGVMGRSMCGHLLAKGHPISVYTRTREKAAALLERGAVWADSPAGAAADADVVFTIVGTPADVRSVYFGPKGVLEATRADMTLVDMTSTEPSLALEIYEAAKAKGARAIDAPVSGGDVGARNATLSIMIGGDRDAVEAIRPLFELMGKNIIYEGGPGAGQHTKVCNQIQVAGTMIGMCECLVYGHKAGLDLETMLTAVRSGAAGCWALDNLAPRVLKRNFNPGFFIDHFVKDMGIALDEARRMKLALPGLALVNQLYVSLQAQGDGQLGTQALTLALERMSGLGETS